MSDPFIDEIASHQMPIQLVIDGAIVENIEFHLSSYGLIGRPLFRDTADRETLLAGPWLVVSDLSHQTSLRCGVDAARTAGKGVFWLGERETDVLYRHLRRLNAARMPDGRILYFRHYDSDVLAAIAPLLDQPQAAQLFGPAQVIALVGGSGDGATVVKPEGLPESPPGPIAFEPWQIDSLNERQRRLSRIAIVRMLREHLPAQTMDQNNSSLEDLVRRNEREAGQAGFFSEKSIGAWAYLDILTNGTFPRDKVLIEMIKSKRSGSPDQNLEVGLPYIIKGINAIRSHRTRVST